MLIGALLRSKGTGTLDSITTEFKDILNKLIDTDTKYRSLLDSNMPAVYVVDCKDIASILKKELSTTLTSKSYGTLSADFGGYDKVSEFFNEEGIDIIGEIISDTNFESELSLHLYNSFLTNTGTLVKERRVSRNLEVDYTIVKGPTIKQIKPNTLDSVFTAVTNYYVKYRSNVTNIIRRPPINYSSIEAQGALLGKKVKDSLKNIGVFRVTDTSKYVSVPNNLSHVICGPSFSLVVENVNKVLDAAFRTFIHNKNNDILQHKAEYKDAANNNNKL